MSGDTTLACGPNTDMDSPTAPAKASHGDIDILICEPLTHPPPSTAALEGLLNSKRSLSTAGRSFATPHPTISDAYVQVDTRVCPDVEAWRWHLFHHAFGDLWNLLGTTIRQFGLTANEKGLHVRIEEIEALDRKKSMIFLTQDPREVCVLLGLEQERLGIDEDGVVRGGDGTDGRGFRNMEEMYEFVTQSRFFRRNSYIRHTLKANDRKRMAQRDGYSAFVDDWLSAYTGSGGEDPELTRASVWEEVIEKYNIEKVYEERIKTWRQERERLKLKAEGRKQRKMAAMEEEAHAEARIKNQESGPAKVVEKVE